MSEEKALDILGLKPGYTENELKIAYKKLMIINHPDKSKKSNSEEYAKLINAARDTLNEIKKNKTISNKKDTIRKIINTINNEYNDISNIVKNIDKNCILYDIVIKSSTRYLTNLIDLLDKLKRDVSDNRLNVIINSFHNYKIEYNNSIINYTLKLMKSSRYNKSRYDIYKDYIEEEFYNCFSHYINNPFLSTIELLKEIDEKYHVIIERAEMKYEIDKIIRKNCSNKSLEEKEILFDKIYNILGTKEKHVTKDKIRRLVKSFK